MGSEDCTIGRKKESLSLTTHAISYTVYLIKNIKIKLIKFDRQFDDLFLMRDYIALKCVLYTTDVKKESKQTMKQLTNTLK